MKFRNASLFLVYIHLSTGIELNKYKDFITIILKKLKKVERKEARRKSTALDKLDTGDKLERLNGICEENSK